jgi:hypothetical protein
MSLKSDALIGTVAMVSMVTMVPADVTGAFWDRITGLQDNRMVNIKNKNARVLAFPTTLLFVNEPSG